jgi:hypothetical protein
MTTAPFTSIYPSAATEKNVTKFMSVMDGKAAVWPMLDRAEVEFNLPSACEFCSEKRKDHPLARLLV